MINPKSMIKQMLEFNKAAFDNSFRGLVLLQDQTEQVAKTLRDQATWLPEEGKKAIDDWFDAYKSGCDNLKTMVDDNFKKVEAFLSV